MTHQFYSIFDRSADYNTSIADGLFDAFGRLRTSSPVSLFDFTATQFTGGTSDTPADTAYQWTDDSGTGTFSATTSALVLGTSETTSTTGVRSWARIPYQPGKSQLVTTTIMLDGMAGDDTARFGYFDDDDGLFFRYTASSGELAFVRRTNVTGTPTDNVTVLNPSPWYDATKANLYWIDFQWLGVGNIRAGILAPDGRYELLHEESGIGLTAPYMRFGSNFWNVELADGATAGGTISVICGSVKSEGGQQEAGRIYTISTGTNPVVSGGTADITPILAIQKSDAATSAGEIYRAKTVVPLAWSVFCTTASQQYEARLVRGLAPADIGSPTFTDQNWGVGHAAAIADDQVATGGEVVDRFYGQTSNGPTGGLVTERSLGGGWSLGQYYNGGWQEEIWAIIVQDITAAAGTYYATITYRVI